MAKVAIEDRIYRHETKPQPTENPPGKIVEAFGLGKCPKLVEQVRSEDLEVRVNTLRALCDEFKNPAIIAGCVKAGLMSTLPKMVLDIDLDTRIYSSKVIGYAARDYNGRTALLEVKGAACNLVTRVLATCTIPPRTDSPPRLDTFSSSQESGLEERAPETVFPALDDDSVFVRKNIYWALENASTSAPGIRALVESGYPAKLVEKAAKEIPGLQPPALRVLRNVIKYQEGLRDALSASLVETLVSLLPEGKPLEVKREASTTLTVACFDDIAKNIAIQNDGIALLAGLLKASTCNVRSAAMGALMMITTVDAGKHAIFPTSAAKDAIKTLQETTDDVLVLNTLKVIASITVHPAIRTEFKEDETCLPSIRTLKESSDVMIAKHAAIALEAVLWEP